MRQRSRESEGKRKKMRGRGAMHRNRGENEMRREGREGRARGDDSALGVLFTKKNCDTKNGPEEAFNDRFIHPPSNRT